MKIEQLLEEAKQLPLEQRFDFFVRKFEAGVTTSPASDAPTAVHPQLARTLDAPAAPQPSGRDVEPIHLKETLEPSPHPPSPMREATIPWDGQALTYYAQTLPEAGADAAAEAGARVEQRPIESPGSNSRNSNDANSDQYIGRQIGPYQLIELLGEGGMGCVYLAQQDKPVLRQVAIKVLKPGADSGSVVARFEAERQTLAMMEHPHIASVLDAGSTDQGSPYFVMELVRGAPITEFCDAQSLSIRQRMAVMIDVCNAVQHAHQKGIIHRDLKPSNILVSLHDGRAVPKVIDFGVAKATTTPLTDVAFRTIAGQVVGTLGYMSPEQAQLTELDIDTRSDIYSLGVVLYELLTGDTPLGIASLENTSLHEILRRIKEEDPPRPSSRVGRTRSDIQQIATSRRVEPRRLGWLIKGDLDWIVLKSLEKDRERRYATASAFAADLQAFLDNQPIDARQASKVYRLRKFVRRNRLLFIFICSVAALLIIGFIVSAGLASWAMAEAKRANAASQLAQHESQEALHAFELANQRQLESETSAQRAKAVLEVMLSSFRSIDPLQQDYSQLTPERLAKESTAPSPSAGESGAPQYAASLLASDVLIHAREALMASAALADDKEAKAELLHTMAQSFIGIGDYERAITTAQQAVELRTEALGPKDRLTLRSACLVGEALNKNHEDARAIDVLQSTYAQQLEVLGPDDAETLTTATMLAEKLATSGKTEQAIELLQHAWELRRAQQGDDDPLTLLAEYLLAEAHWRHGERKHAAELFESLLPKQQRVLGEQHPATLRTLADLSTIYRRFREYQRAIDLQTKVLETVTVVLGPEHPVTLECINTLATAYLENGNLDQAKRLYTEVLELQQKLHGDDHFDVLQVLHNLGFVHSRQGNLEEAVRLHQSSYEKATQTLGEEHPMTLQFAHNLAGTYVAAGQHQQAVDLYQKTIDGRRRVLGDEHPDVIQSMTNLAVACFQSGDFDTATKLFQQTFDMRRRQLGETDADTLRSLNNLISAYQRQGDVEQLEKLLQETLQLRHQSLGRENAHTVAIAKVLFELQTKQAINDLSHEEFERAEELAQRVITLATEYAIGKPAEAYGNCLLAAALSGQQQWDEATALFLQFYLPATDAKQPLARRRNVLSWAVEHFQRAKAPEQAARFQELLDKLPSPTTAG